MYTANLPAFFAVSAADVIGLLLGQRCSANVVVAAAAVGAEHKSRKL